MKLLMTGSTSFLGRYLVPLIEHQGWEIWHLVRKPSGFENEIICDLKDPLPKDLPACEAIIHLAAHVDFGQQISVEQYETNTLSTFQFADYARMAGAYFIFASMAGVHGFDKTNISEETPLEPDTHYAVSKYLGEACIRRMLDNYSILRIGGIYGIDGPNHLALNRAIREACSNRVAPMLKGPGQGRRNYILVSDAARWIVHLLSDFQRGNSSDKRDTLYVSGPEVLTIESYLQTIVDICLPGTSINRTAGNETRDQIVHSSPCPFERTIFANYLHLILDGSSIGCNGQ